MPETFTGYKTTSSMRFLFTIILSSLFFTKTLAQNPLQRYSSNGISGRKSYNRNSSHPFSMIIFGGLTQFFGELNGQDMHSVLGIELQKSFSKEFAVAMNFTAGKTGGEKLEFFNSYFVNEYNTTELLFKWDITEQYNRQEPGPLHWIVYGGVGQIYFTANAFDLDDGQLLRFTNSKLSARNPLFLRWGKPTGPPGIRKTREGILPIGTSFEYAMLPALKMSVGYQFYFVRTDKMDATSGRRLTNPEERESYSDTPNDKFGFLAFSIGCYFGKTKHYKKYIK